ncbi:MAG: hypothetical protein GYB15_20615 [Gammaproteobacteria bacterium]|nr:hypothetical protein [Gammaproteobacteria bacterium]
MRDIDIIYRIVDKGKIAQFASQSVLGPRVFNAWYAFDRQTSGIIMTTSKSTNHVREWEERPLAGGTILGIQPDGLGQRGEAVSFFGNAMEVVGVDLERVYSVYSEKWPRILTMVPLEAVVNSEGGMRFYEIRVSEWVLYSEFKAGATRVEVKPETVCQG